MGLDHRPLHDKINVKCTVNVETWTSETILKMFLSLSWVEEESTIYIEEVNFEKPWTYLWNYWDTKKINYNYGQKVWIQHEIDLQEYSEFFCWDTANERTLFRYKRLHECVTQ